MYKMTANYDRKPGLLADLAGNKILENFAVVDFLTENGQRKGLETGKSRDYIAKFLEKGIVNYLNNSTTLGEFR
jgi:hypothetical protein